MNPITPKSRMAECTTFGVMRFDVKIFYLSFSVQRVSVQ